MSECPASEPPLVIGLVNNMPDGALKATEEQFGDLLHEAAGPAGIHLRKFFLPSVPRRESGRHHLSQSYSPLSELMDCRLDGLIVTGAVPSGARFEHEPFWPCFTQLADWANENKVPTFWSCLAAHAAVKHFHGIERYRMSRKLSGVFSCEKAAAHPLLAGAPSRWQAPHSRYNDLREADLAAVGYRILSRLESGSPDMFVNPGQNLSVFSQGHLEYDETTLFYEYRRDLGQYLRGHTAIPPSPPAGYFEPGTVEAIEGLNGLEPGGAPAEYLGVVEDILSHAVITANWQPMAHRVFANWIRLLRQERSCQRAVNAATAARPGQGLSGELEWRVE
ncbi:MAG: homoserine O-succinyltransferase [Rhodomicrobium sp.]